MLNLAKRCRLRLPAEIKVQTSKNLEDLNLQQRYIFKDINILDTRYTYFSCTVGARHERAPNFSYSVLYFLVLSFLVRNLQGTKIL